MEPTAAPALIDPSSGPEQLAGKPRKISIPIEISADFAINGSFPTGGQILLTEVFRRV